MRLMLVLIINFANFAFVILSFILIIWKNITINKYKCLLEYFVTHLEYVQTESQTILGYKKYIEPILKDFITTGVGYKDQAIQSQISDWSEYGEHLVCINITCSFGSYMTNQCYLNWQGTWFNTRPKWDKSRQKIIELYLSRQAKATAKPELSFKLSELGLFDNLPPNDNLKKFYDLFESLIINEEKHNAMLPYTELLIANKNLILTGAPGTGKTFLAKQIAKELGATEENQQCMMVQFHPSYDYTDFVEGLRPTKKEDDLNIGFQLTPGSFKSFCAQALENFLDSKKSSHDISIDTSFRNAYDEMIDKVRGEELSEIPLRKSTASMEIVEVSDNNNLILKAKNSETGKTYTVSYARLKKLSAVYESMDALDAISNIDKAVRDAIKGCNTSAYWATLYFLYKNFMQDKKVEEMVVERKNYVFIIDEINRGEISKIFGELFFSIDPGYRGIAGTVQTQYQNLIEEGEIYEKGFYVPENVYIIGTMNDIDRSVDSMDFAMRRRFAWKEIKANDRLEMLNDLDELKTIAIKRMQNLNDAIERTEGLNSSYHIGPAYFKKVMLYKDNSDTMWTDLWEYHIKGVLYEYVRGTDDVDTKMANFENAYNL